MSSKFHLQDGTLSVLEQVDILFKRDKGKVSVDILRPFYQETLNVRPAVLFSQIWSEAVPTTAPADLLAIDPETALDDNGDPLKGSAVGLTSSLNPVVRRFHKLQLQEVPGANNLGYYYPQNGSGYSPFRDVIPFNHDPNGTYEVFLYRDGSEAQIPFGPSGGEWNLNHEMATITFFQYSVVSSIVSRDKPPLVSFYQYNGDKGVAGGGTSELFSKEFNGGDGTCGDGARALCIDTERGPLGTLLGDGDCSYALQFGPDSSCGSWRMIVVGNGDGSTSLHFQYRTNTFDVWRTKMHIDPAECDTTCT
jgi:hypothetical protein